MVVAGQLYRLRTLGRITGGSGCGSWLTPSTEDHKSDGPKALAHYQRNAEDGTPIPTSYQRLRNQVAAKTWPTPKGSPSGPDYARAEREGSGGDDLATAEKNSRPLNEVVTAAEQKAGGSLNPEFVEWLMGWPRGWTDVQKPFASDYGSWDNQTRGEEDATAEAGPGEVLQNVQGEDAQASVQRQDRGSQRLYAPMLLLQELYGLGAAQRNADHEGPAQANADGGSPRHQMPGVSGDDAPAAAPSGSGPDEQRPLECEDVVRLLSRPMALAEWEDCAEATVGLLRLRTACAMGGYVRETLATFQEAWQSLSGEEKEWTIVAARGGPWVAEWPGVSRLATGVKDRVSRLRILGNGWVPHCAVYLAGRIQAWLDEQDEAGRMTPTLFAEEPPADADPEAQGNLFEMEEGGD
jgi:hypothetical protein